MFQVILDERHTYKVAFQHQRPTNGHAPNRGITICEITRGQSFVGWGVSNMDNLDKNRGRKMALRDALYDAGFERMQRFVFWVEYFHAHGRVE